MKAVKQIMLVVLGLFLFALQGCSHEDYIPVPGQRVQMVQMVRMELMELQNVLLVTLNHIQIQLKRLMLYLFMLLKPFIETTNASGATITLKTSEYTNRNWLHPVSY